MTYDPIKLEIFKHLFAAVAEEMGTVLRKSSYSPNIKERRDFSCALFDARGQMVAQAAHIPVHLGAMPLSVQAAVDRFGDELHPGDLIVLNDPFRGGTHLPDITMVSPVFFTTEHTESTEKTRRFSADSANSVVNKSVVGFVASRAHHADVGGMTPGSMPVAREIYQEGLILPPVRLARDGKMDQDILEIILSNVRTPEERHGDLLAQIAANQRGAVRLVELVARYGRDEVDEAMGQLLAYTKRMTRRLLASLPDGTYRFADVLDNDGVTGAPIPITVAVSIAGEAATVDFTGSASQQQGSVNAVYAITLSAVYYVFRCLLGLDVPNNAGCLAPIRVIAPAGTVVNALSPAPVAGGNVETSQRIVDVLLGALAQACPEKVPAASQGTMNNVTIGGNYPLPWGPGQFAYYETVGGGTGARPNANGISAIHSHMTNTLNTPVEALEYAYPLRVRKYAVRDGSGGDGQFRGGDGIVREIEVLTDCQVTLLTERRVHAPYGLASGGSGKCGENVLIRDGKESSLPGKGSVDLKAGDVLSIRTPGGGGYGVKSS
ncbi:MAG: hydantoinase B/oxoprolinase family protein [Chloroflexi bacterium]|nr:hydantoinase B/oxoprolinase family protein [Chloroflexota bacterium]